MCFNMTLFYSLPSYLYDCCMIDYKCCVCLTLLYDLCECWICQIPEVIL